MTATLTGFVSPVKSRLFKCHLAQDDVICQPKPGMASEQRPPLATALQIAMDEKGWSIAETERQSGVDERTIYRYLSDKPPKKPRRSVLSKLALALGAPGLVGFSSRQPPPAVEERLTRLEERVDFLLEHLDGDRPTPA